MASKNPWGIPYMSGAETRQSYIDFFKERDHKFVPSSPVVPHDDPTLLFINAGMNQFKSLFLGDNRQGLKRAVNSQKCIRVSGKHNDLDEVGRDTYHQTFFEMLGNWSFGDYYKKEAIRWAWELLTEVYKLPKDRLFATVYKDDDEAMELWKSETDIDPWRIMRFDEEENFWEMGDTGPCGPSSEIHFDLGDTATQKDTYQDKDGGVNGTGGRYIEIWNLVFMQYERLGSGELKPLDSKHVDTGMGFERMCSIIQGTGSNYETDVFSPIIQNVADLTGVPYEKGEAGTPHRVIADHVRALAFAIADGANPGNEGRGYVLRRILRRASRFSRSLNQKEPFIYRLVPKLVEVMGPFFEELKQRQDYIAEVIYAEEERFMRTLRDGLSRFEKIVGETKKKGRKTIAGKDVFTLYDTYGFPMDLTGVLAEENGLAIDEKGFQECMEEQRERARSAAKFGDNLASDEGWTILDERVETQFVGYETLECEADVTRYQAMNGDMLVCLNKSPFYAESGGQVGDVGWLKNDQLELEVLDTFKVLEMQIHKCKVLKGELSKDTATGLKATVDRNHREATVRNHSATHLLHGALRTVLGDHVVQQGSRVGPDSLRFDFTHPKPLSDKELRQVETIVNEQILANASVAVRHQPLEEAKEQGAIAMFGEKYDDTVRTIQMGEFSYELCGGTHARATGDIGFFVITSEASIAAGIRRIEAVTGLEALHYVRRQSESLSEISKSLKAKPDTVTEKVSEMVDRMKTLEKELKSLRQEQVNLKAQQLVNQAETVNGIPCVITRLDPEEFPKNTHQTLLDGLAAKLGSGVAVLTQVREGNLALLAAVGPDLRDRVKAGDLIKELSTYAGGRGGGRADKAQAGSKQPENEPVVMEQARKLLEEKLTAVL